MSAIFAEFFEIRRARAPLSVNVPDLAVGCTITLHMYFLTVGQTTKIDSGSWTDYTKIDFEIFTVTKAAGTKFYHQRIHTFHVDRGRSTVSTIL
jgi:hypothetical protein